ncbi:MAG: hypothetical protein JO353_03040 [Phycisphaerae bacterium]|nr:hypothetical protein [Phycisphaerae bacterium]
MVDNRIGVLRNLTNILTLLVVLGILSGGMMVYRAHFAADTKIAKLEDDKRVLNEVVSHLTGERRVADLVVTDQHLDADGVPVTTLLFVENGRNGTDLPGRSFSVRGKLVHVDAMVIKFDAEDVKANDPLRGRSIALFTRIYGDRQNPADAEPIDPPGEPPAIYRDADPTLAGFELKLWNDFWHLAADPAYAASKHVRVANGESVWGMFDPDRLYTLTLENNGGLNLSSAPIKGIYREMLKQAH